MVVNSIFIRSIGILQLGEKSEEKCTENSQVFQILLKVCLSVKSLSGLYGITASLLFFRTVSIGSEITTAILCQLNPHLLFISFAESVDFDHSFLLDLLISSETRFLEYLVQYLHFAIAGWSSFVQCSVEYEERISCTAELEEVMSDEVGMCRVRPMEFESDSNSSEKPSEFESHVAIKMRSSENVSFARQEIVAGEDRPGCPECLELRDTFSWPQSSSCEKCETSPELCQSDSLFMGIQSGGLNGLTSIVLAYSSSDESEVENEFENESANEHKTPAVSQSDFVISSSVCLNNNQLGFSSFDNADDAETSRSTFTAKSCCVPLQTVPETPRIHTNNLANSTFSEHIGFPSNQPDGDSNLNVSDCLGDQSSSSSTKLLCSSDRNTEIFIAKENRSEGGVADPTAVDCELLDKVMTMLIRLRLSVTSLSSGGHFPYCAAPLISLMENIEKCYDGC